MPLKKKTWIQEIESVFNHSPTVWGGDTRLIWYKVPRRKQTSPVQKLLSPVGIPPQEPSNQSQPLPLLSKGGGAAWNLRF